MLLKRKLCISTAIAIAAVSIFGNGANTAYADGGLTEVTQITQQVSKSSLQNGEYKGENKILDKSDTALKSYRAFFAKETKLVVKDGKYYLTFTNTMAKMVPTVKAKIGENDLNITTKPINEDKYEFIVELSDLSSRISMSFEMGATIFNCDVILDVNSLEVVKLDETQEPQQPEQSVIPEQTEKEETTDDTQKEETVDKEDVKYKDGIYTLTNEITDNKNISMIRYSVGEKTSVEIKDGKTYITLNILNYDYVGKVSIKVDGKVVEHTQENSETDKTATLKFEVPSLDSDIQMTMYSPIAKKDSVFGVVLNKSTMNATTNNQQPNQSTDSTTDKENNNTNSNITTDSNSSETTDTVVENTVVKGKRYSIKNEVTAKSATSKKMGRNFLNETSRIEEVNGKTYAVLTFTRLDMMNNHRIYVDGNKVSHQVVSKTNDSVTIKFLIPCLNSDLIVVVYVVPMAFDSEFNVKLLENTKGAVEEFETSSSLPQTGSLLNTEAMIGLGGIVSVSGALLNRRKKNN